MKSRVWRQALAVESKLAALSSSSSTRLHPTCVGLENQACRKALQSKSRPYQKLEPAVKFYSVATETKS